jgi:hypothetical protein
MHLQKIGQECAQIIRDRLQTIIDLGVEVGKRERRCIGEVPQFVLELGRENMPLATFDEVGPKALRPAIFFSLNTQEPDVLRPKWFSQPRQQRVQIPAHYSSKTRSQQGFYQFVVVHRIIAIGTNI